MNEENKSLWTPKEVRKTLNFGVGVILIAAGIWLIVNGVKAEGSFDFKTELLSGKLQSSSVGLFIVLFGIVFLLLTNLSGISDYLKLVKNNKVLVLTFLIILFLFALIGAYIFNTIAPLMFMFGATLGGAFPILLFAIRSR